MKIKFNFQKVLKIFLQASVLILGSIILIIILKVFCFASFTVPSGSMEPTLKTGDYILVNKMIFGPRVFKDWKFWTDGNLEMRRLKGLRSIKRNEILVFNFPISNYNWSKIEMDFNSHYVKRCVGIPGDTLYIANGFYKVKGCSDTLGIYPNQLMLSNMTNKRSKDGTFKFVPFDSVGRYTITELGPFYIPKANDTLNIDSQNISLYSRLIVYETGKKIEIIHNKVLLEGKIISRYIFKLNYYFMAGDNVFGSYDSRYWGLLPEDHIIGKVAFIWKSKDENTGKYKWERFFKGV